MSATPPDLPRPTDDDQPDRSSPTAMPPRHRLALPAVTALAVASLLLGALAAFADDARPARTQARAPTPRAAAARDRARVRPAAVVPVPRVALARAAPTACPEKATSPATAPVPQDILAAFGVLRRDRTAADDLPADALRALRDRGLEPFDPAAARLLRTTADGGRAWVVPVRDVARPLGRFACFVRAVPPSVRPMPPAPARPPRVKPPSAAPAVPAVPTTPPTVTPAPAPRTVPPTAAPVPAPPTAPAPGPAPSDHQPEPGLAVVAIGGAPVGAGGAPGDLVRGREQVEIDPCGGPGNDMLTVSGLVPDGVSAAFLTSADGTAVRADVKDNGYAFVVPPTSRAAQRYVVWTGGDGTPHVQPLTSPAYSARVRCATPPKGLVRVSPSGGGACPYLARRFPLPVAPVPGSRTRTIRPFLVQLAPCDLAAPLAALSVPPAPPRVAAPIPRRHG